jgi:hypothetical protein
MVGNANMMTKADDDESLRMGGLPPATEVAIC